ncbi:hypothetical protein ACH41H_36315 [Streptomyces sp. NPDC020800]|uniref:hypothetical protein n=1 Tax=Streptomyces sp. NPDC020800 TaxID=3365092 RepID=UPI00379B01AC
MVLRQEGLDRSLYEISHLVGSGDRYRRCRVLECLKSAQGGTRSIAYLVVGCRVGGRFHDRSHCVFQTPVRAVALLQERRVGGASFIAEAVTDVCFFLVGNLFASCMSLNQGAAQCAEQGSNDAKSRRPDSGIPLIHAGHHAVLGVHRADA